MSSSLKRIVIEKETHARSDRWYKIKKKCHPSLSKNTSRHNYVVLGYLWERVSRHSHRRIICSYFKQMLCHDYMAFSCACQSLLIFNCFFRPIFVLGSLKVKINLIQTIVTSILTRRLEKAFLVFMKRNSNRLQSKGRSHPRCFFLTTVLVVHCPRRKLLWS